MARKVKSSESTSSSKKIRPALTPEARELQMISLAVEYSGWLARNIRMSKAVCGIFISLQKGLHISSYSSMILCKVGRKPIQFIMHLKVQNIEYHFIKLLNDSTNTVECQDTVNKSVCTAFLQLYSEDKSSNIKTLIYDNKMVCPVHTILLL